MARQLEPHRAPLRSFGDGCLCGLPREGAIEGEDLLQESLVLLLSNDGFRRATVRAQLATQFVTIRFLAFNVNRFDSKFRDLQQHPHLAVPGATGPGDVATCVEFVERFYEEMGVLPPQMAEDFVACALEGQSNAERAAETKRKTQTVKNSVAEARKRLREKLRPIRPDRPQ